MTEASTAAPAVKRPHPKGLPVLFTTEMWERFSFYSMRALFSLYMISPKSHGGLGFSTQLTAQIYGLYVGFVYFTPLLGGIIADRWLGIKRSIIIGGLFMMCGHFLLAFRPLPFFFSALVCLVIGNGMFKPNISTMLGNLYRKVPERQDDGYNIFYMGINLGAFLSPLVAGYLRSLDTISGWHYGFAAAGIGMIFSIMIFLSLQRIVKEGDIPPAKYRRREEAEPQNLGDPETNRQRTMALMVVFFIVIFFWMAFEQQGLTLTFWAMEATNTAILPEMFQAVNPMFILLFTFPVVAFWGLLRRYNREPTTAAKMVVGMLLTVVCYLVLAFAALSGGNTGHVGVGWLLAAYALITLGELCLSPMGLSLVSKLAPPGKLGMMMGGWFVAAGIGGYLSGLVGGFWDRMSHSNFFLMLVASSLVIALVLCSQLKKLNPIIHKAEREAAESAA